MSGRQPHNWVCRAAARPAAQARLPCSPPPPHPAPCRVTPRRRVSELNTALGTRFYLKAYEAGKDTGLERIDLGVLAAASPHTEVVGLPYGTWDLEIQTENGNGPGATSNKQAGVKIGEPRSGRPAACMRPAAGPAAALPLLLCRLRPALPCPL